jgi:hypothetical protein
MLPATPFLSDSFKFDLLRDRTAKLTDFEKREEDKRFCFQNQGFPFALFLQVAMSQVLTFSPTSTKVPEKLYSESFPSASSSDSSSEAEAAIDG